MMTNQIRYYLIFIAGTIFSEILSGQDLQDSLYDAIPIEAYEGFNHDTFTFPGETNVRQVFKVGVYKSNVKIHLEEVGEVYVHHVLYFQERDYPYMEVYSRQPSSGFIQGIKRYGHYRMFSRQSFEAEDRYNGDSRIEFVNGLNKIVRSINPRKVFIINEKKEMDWEADNGELTRIGFKLKDCSKSVDSSLYASSIYSELGQGCTFSGFIEYVLEEGLIMVNLHASITVDEPSDLVTFESVMYNTHGLVAGRVSEPLSVHFMDLTDNHEYVYISSGGSISEDGSLPYGFKIARLNTGEVIFERKSTSDYIAGFVLEGTNLGVYEVKHPFPSPGVLEAYVIDHDRNVMYLIHHNALCQPPFYISFSTDYCECWTSNGLKAKLYYDKDFTSVTFIKQ